MAKWMHGGGWSWKLRAWILSYKQEAEKSKLEMALDFKFSKAPVVTHLLSLPKTTTG